MSENNLFQRNGIWWLRYKVAGEERRESLRTRNIRDARKIRDQRLKVVEEERRGEIGPSWKEAVTAWCEHEQGQIASTTAKRYATSLLMVEEHLAPYTIEKITGSVIAELIKARRAVATPATVRRDLTAVSRVLDYAEAMGWREGNPTLSKRRLLKERRDPIMLPRAEDIEAVIAASPPRFGALIRAALLTGCRQNELVTAKWRGFRREFSALEVIGKKNKRRVLSLSEEAVAHFSAQPRTLRADLIFCREDGAPFMQAASDFTHFRRKAEKAAAKARRPFTRFRFHDLRHLFAVEALRSGTMSIYTLSKHMGHTSVKTTEIYLEFLTPEEAAVAREGVAQSVAQIRRFGA